VLEKNPSLRPSATSDKSKQKGKKEANETVNAMTTFEFSNFGVERHYSGAEASDTSINTQFDTIDLEDGNEVGKQQFTDVQFLAQTDTNHSSPFHCVVMAALKQPVNNDNSDLNNNKLKVLLDSGASSSIVYKKRLPHAIVTTLKHKHTPTVWTTNTGTFTTDK